MVHAWLTEHTERMCVCVCAGVSVFVFITSYFILLQLHFSCLFTGVAPELQNLTVTLVLVFKTTLIHVLYITRFWPCKIWILHINIDHWTAVSSFDWNTGTGGRPISDSTSSQWSLGNFRVRELHFWHFFFSSLTHHKHISSPLHCVRAGWHGGTVVSTVTSQ